MISPVRYDVIYKVHYDDSDPSKYRVSKFTFRDQAEAMSFSRELDKVGRAHEVQAVYEFALAIRTSDPS
jgi:hypothetical protein